MRGVVYGNVKLVLRPISSDMFFGNLKFYAAFGMF